MTAGKMPAYLKKIGDCTKKAVFICGNEKKVVTLHAFLPHTHACTTKPKHRRCGNKGTDDVRIKAQKMWE